MTQLFEKALALLKRRLHNHNKAFTDYVAAVEFTQIKPDFLGPPNDTYMSKKEREKQIAELTAAIEKEPDNPEHLLQRGCAYTCFGETKGHSPDAFDNAIADFTAAHKMKPDNPHYLRFRALTYYYQKEYDKAIADFTAALKIKEGEKEYLAERGRVYHCKEDYDNAIADYNAAAVQGEDLIWRGIAYACKKEYDKAIADLEESSHHHHYEEMAKALLQKVREKRKAF